MKCYVDWEDAPLTFEGWCTQKRVKRHKSNSNCESRQFTAFKGPRGHTARACISDSFPRVTVTGRPFLHGKTVVLLPGQTFVSTTTTKVFNVTSCALVLQTVRPRYNSLRNVPATCFLCVLIIREFTGTLWIHDGDGMDET